MSFTETPGPMFAKPSAATYLDSIKHVEAFRCACGSAMTLNGSVGLTQDLNGQLQHWVCAFDPTFHARITLRVHA